MMCELHLKLIQVIMVRKYCQIFSVISKQELKLQVIVTTALLAVLKANQTTQNVVLKWA